MTRSFRVSAGLLAALSACAEEAREPGSFFGDGCVVDMEAPLCEDCIDFAHVTTLGSDELGPGFLVPMGTTEHVVRDRLGNYWVGQSEQIKVFDAEGGFLWSVGRGGGGPMEFGEASPIHADAAGRVHVVDAAKRRISVIDDAFALVEEKRLPAGISAWASLDDGERYVVQASVELPGRIGMPLHIVGGSGVLKSFGAGEERDEESWLGAIDLRLTGGPAGRVFAAHPVEYLIEAWSQEGERVGALRGEPALNAETSWDEPMSPDNPPPNGITGIRVDSDGLLWVSLLILQPDWLQHLIWDPAGDVSSEVGPDVLTRIYRPRLDVIDLATCTMVASASQLRDLWLILLDERTVLGFGFTELGAAKLDVLRVRLDR